MNAVQTTLLAGTPRHRATVLEQCIIPRAARIPSDLAALTAEDPMSLTLRHMGGQARVDRAHANAIRNLIADALAGR